MVRKVAVGALLGLFAVAVALWQLASYNGRQAERATISAQATTAFLVSMFADANPGVTGDRDLTVEELLNRARSTIGSEIDVNSGSRAALLSALGEIYMRIGNYEVAEELLSAAAESLPFLERDDPAAAVRVLLELGGLRMEQRRLDEGAEYLGRALEKAPSLDDSRLLAKVINTRGLLESRQQQYATAISSFDQAIALLDQVDSDSTETIKLRANIYNNAGMNHIHLGELAAAGRDLQAAISLRQEHGLDMTAEHASLLANLGSLLRRQGRNEESIPLYEQAIELSIRLHGPNHPRNAIFLVNLVSAQLALGLADQAAENAERGLAVVAASSGANAVVAALLKAKLVSAMWLARRLPGSDRVDAVVEAIAELAETYGPDHAVVVETQAAILGVKLDTVGGGAGRCDDLGRIRAKHDSTNNVNVRVRERLLEYSSRGGVCAPR